MAKRTPVIITGLMQAWPARAWTHGLCDTSTAAGPPSNPPPPPPPPPSPLPPSPPPPSSSHVEAAAPHTDASPLPPYTRKGCTGRANLTLIQRYVRDTLGRSVLNNVNEYINLDRKPADLHIRSLLLRGYTTPPLFGEDLLRTHCFRDLPRRWASKSSILTSRG